MEQTQQSSAPFITLQPNERTFTLTDAAKRLAWARVPESEPLAAYPLRLDAPDTRGHVLTPEDEQVLRDVWKGAGLNRPKFPMKASSWMRYREAFDKSPQRPDWWLWQCATDPALLRVAVETQFKDAIEGAIRAGQIVARNPMTGLPADASSLCTAQNDYLVLSRDDFIQFARGAMIEVLEADAEPSMPDWQKRALRSLELKGQGDQASTSKTAAEFGVSASQVRDDVRRWKRQQAGQ